MYEEQHFTHDAAVATFKEDTSGVTVDDDGTRHIDWDSVEQVTIDNPPYAEAFDTKKFYRLPATVAKPIPQPYHYGEDSLVWLKKPREELKRAAWSLDNAPVTLSHPDTTMVKDVGDVHGFWNETHYIDSLDELDSYAHIPVGDEEAKRYVEENGDVSVGFYNKIARIDDYDGIVGGGDDDRDVDGYQTNMLFDHCAFVEQGRCSSEHGCGLDASPSHGRGHVAMETDDGVSFISVTDITDISETAEEQVDTMQQTVDQPEGIYVDDGDWYGISPSENPDGDSPKYQLNTCNDVKDAWNLRAHGNYSIEQSTLEARIKRVGDSKDCSDANKPWTDAYDGPVDVSVDDLDYCIEPCEDCNCNDTDTENTNTETFMTEFEFDLDDLEAEAAIDKLAERHPGVEEVVDELSRLRELEASVDEVTEKLDMGLDEVVDAVDELTEKADAYDEIEQEKMAEDAGRLAEMADRFETADDVLAEYDSHDDILDRIELLEDAIETSETTTDAGTETTKDREDDIRGGRHVPEAWK